MRVKKCSFIALTLLPVENYKSERKIFKNILKDRDS